MGEFVDAILKFNAQTKENADRVLRHAVQDLAEDVTKPRAKGGRMPVDTGFLRASFNVTLNNPVLTPTFKPDGEGFYAFDDAAIGLTINNAKIGDVVYLTFTANYARHVEYGAKGRPPAAFVRTYANPVSWQGYVNRAAQKVAS